MAADLGGRDAEGAAGSEGLGVLIGIIWVRAGHGALGCGAGVAADLTGDRRLISGDIGCVGADGSRVVRWRALLWREQVDEASVRFFAGDRLEVRDRLADEIVAEGFF